eukprot:TRINITY_DN4495_c0_g1_i1.p1 TRINITY_DN4495_c0_g1~~TRINITY_DN4495_c0_g1_i1.p1  ORF type:complete len:313 (+),score=115.66 TRINITY_DN4495_c0_g1_i1:83-940(+)
MTAGTGAPSSPAAPGADGTAKPKAGAAWQLIGNSLTTAGGVFTLMCPLGLGGVMVRLWTLSFALRLSMPLLLSVVLALFCIDVQRRGGIRAWHLVPEPRRSLVWAVSRFTVWPTIAFNMCRTAAGFGGQYVEEVTGTGPDEPGKIYVGGLPWPMLAKRLKRGFNVTRVVNCCEESAGPHRVYDREGIEQLRLYCIDYCDVPLERITQGVSWLREQILQGHNVYVHCKAGKGRAATIVVAYLARYHFGGDAERANKHLKERRRVAISSIHRRPDVRAYLKQHCPES